jgi:hypothetical protein
MNRRLKISFPAVILVVSMLACNTPVEQVAPPNEIQTAAALTLQVIFTPSMTSTGSAPAITNTVSPILTQTQSTAGSPTVTISPTYSVPTLTIQESTNCRTGPGEEYDIVVTYLTGKKLEIAGRYDPGNFWLVKSNESPSGTCWLWGQYVELAGSYTAVASVTPPATSTSAPPRGPGIIKWEFFCTGGSLTFNVTWADNAKDETGYRVFRNGEQAAELPADTTTFTDTVEVSGDQSLEYYMQVYSPTGTANSSVMRMKC